MSKLPADMPQEDVETKSLLTLILDKIAELWTNIQSGFTNLTGSIEFKGNWVVDKINESLETEASVNVKNVISVNKPSGTLVGTPVILEVNGVSKILSLCIFMNKGHVIRLTVDDVYYDIEVSYDGANIYIPYAIIPNMVNNEVRVLIKSKENQTSLMCNSLALTDTSVLNLKENTRNNVHVYSSASCFVIPNEIKAYHHLKIQLIENKALSNPNINYGILVTEER